MKTRFWVIFSFFVVLVFSTIGISSADAAVMQLKHQVSGASEPDNYTCWAFTQLLVERPNGKFACISPYAMMKLDWQPYNYHSYNFDVSKGNSTYSVFAHNSSESTGMISGIEYDDDAFSLLIDLPRTNPGKLFIEIPRMLLDAKYAMVWRNN